MELPRNYTNRQTDRTSLHYQARPLVRIRFSAFVPHQIDGDGMYCCSFFTVTTVGLRVGGGGAALWQLRQAGAASAPMATPNASEPAIAAQKAPAALPLSALLASWAAMPSSA